jgi:hypothetical protein
MKKIIDLSIFKNLLFALLAVSFSFASHAQEDLKNLREGPETNIVTSDSSKKIEINPVQVPIPKLGLKVNYWKHWTKFGINANQASFSDNWRAGGVNPISLLGTAWHKSDYSKNNFNFVTELDFKYGKIQNKDQLAKKNNDRIFWDNKLSYTFSKDWAVYFSVTFESQFDLGYRYGKDEDGEEVIVETVSSFLGPGYFTESLGLEYKPSKEFSLRLGTGTARQTVVLDERVKPRTVEEYAERYPDYPAITKDQVKFGLEVGEKVKNDLAFQITANLDKNLSPNLNLKSRYNLFADYKEISKPDHRLDATLSAKVTKLVNVTLTGIMLYDNDWIVGDDTKAKIQFSQALALGMVFTLPR